MKGQRVILPLLVGALFLIFWHVLVKVSKSDIFPTPWQVMLGLMELVKQGLLLKYIVASLFRVTWGFLLAILVAARL